MSYSSPWPPPATVTSLVAEAQSGSAESVNTLLTALRPALVGFFARRLSDDAAEDLAQAALLRIARALPSIEPDRADRFILTIACNLVRTATASERATSDAGLRRSWWIPPFPRSLPTSTPRTRSLPEKFTGSARQSCRRC